MSALTKDQIERLTPEAQEAVANLVLRRVELIDKAKQYRGQIWIASLVPAALMLLFLFGFGKTLPSRDRFVLFAMLMVVSVSANVHIKGINLRLDAIVELLETKVEPSTGDNAAAPRVSS